MKQSGMSSGSDIGNIVTLVLIGQWWWWSLVMMRIVCSMVSGFILQGGRYGVKRNLSATPGHLTNRETLSKVLLTPPTVALICRATRLFQCAPRPKLY